jgi:hypothetical protein
VYGGNIIANTGSNGINNYNYFHVVEGMTLTAGLNTLAKYNNSWPVDEKYLNRFEVYRNILNSNRRLCTWWVGGTDSTYPSDALVETVGIAKWVLDKSIAPYPILKKWDKYYSTFDMDTVSVWNPQTHSNVLRSSANAWEGKSLGTLSVTIKSGTHHVDGSSNQYVESKNLTITDMDTLGYDYCAYKVQLPYYNEIFGNSGGATWSAKYGDNYTEKVVTGWKIISVNGNDVGEGYTFNGNCADPDKPWEDGYNFADRSDKYKDLFAKSGRVFAQGGYYYVPEGVTSITIEAYWGNAVYLCNSGRRLDMVNNGGNQFTKAGQLPEYINTNIKVKTSLADAVKALDSLKTYPTFTVYDQAIVLVGNYQKNNFQSSIKLKGNEYDNRAKPFTIMSADFDFDNEPDFCFQAGMSNGGRENIHPIRFDFLTVPDITMAIRINVNYYGMRIFCPQGHFETTETAYIYTTQFEYDERNNSGDYYKHEAPIILNGGEFMQIVSSEHFTQNDNNWVSKTNYFLMGGKLYMHAFTPGTHGNKEIRTRHCAVNAIGGEYPEFYLSGMFKSTFYNRSDNPHCYIDGGKFGLVAGAGMESVGAKNDATAGNVTFKINHAWIKEFYGGGINANRPVAGNISTTCDNSIIHKYCGGPKVGDMRSSKTITTNATKTIFGQFFGGGNGGTNLLRDRKYDAGAGVNAPTQSDHSHWDGLAKFDAFTPFSYVADSGYQVEYEFEMLPKADGLGKVITRSYYYWATFTKTIVAPITNTLTDCTVKSNFYGGGNLGAVTAPANATAITSTLGGNTVIMGSAYGGGYSSAAASFAVHDKSTVKYPYRDVSGYIHGGGLDYQKYAADIEVNGVITHHQGDTIQYTWTHADALAEPYFFENPVGSGDWYCKTTQTLTDLGTVTGDVKLTVQDNTVIHGDVFGAGDASAVTGSTEVQILNHAKIRGNVYGGGNRGTVGGNTKVIINGKE